MRIFLAAPLLLIACTPLDQVGRAPAFSPLDDSFQHSAMYATPMPQDMGNAGPMDDSSLWASGRESLFGDRRANHSGDILTVVIEIDDSAELKNSTGRTRTGSEKMGVGSLFGIPERVDAGAANGASLADAVDTSGSSTFAGSGNVSRKEKLTLRVAATVVEELPNGVLRIEGQQEVRVNFELRELLITGYVRPIDISRQNEITYDKIAGARISYGGRGLISNAQQPRYGQQISDVLLPF
jgi:flagellar L-ring protein precursor FlgH